MNLAEFVKDGEFDFEDFKRAVDISVRALNEVLDEGLPLHPLQEQRDSVRDWRQIGLGIFGLADMLIKMGLTYGDKESLDICFYIGRVMIDTAMYSSCMLAKEQGAFPMYDEDNTFESAFFKTTASHDTQVAVEKYGLRNSQLLTIAPTGTLSTMLGVSGGIEPMFATHYDRLTQSLHGEDKSYRIYTTIVKEYMEKNGLSDVSELPEYFVTSKDINYKNRIQMQSVWQDSIDASISSTINLPNDATVEDVMEIYMLAWHNLLKGITVYRDGCKRGAILSAPTEEPVGEKNATTELQRGVVLDVHDDVIGKKRKLVTGCGSLHCTAFFDPTTGDLMETYLSKGSTGGCNNFMVGLSRMISLSARAGVAIDTIVDQLDSTGACPSYAVRRATKGDASKGACCPMAIGNVIKEMWLEVQDELGIEDGVEEVYELIEVTKIWDSEPKFIKNIESEACPSCGETLRFEGGCNSCPSCGWSRCS